MSFFNRQGIPGFMMRHYTDQKSDIQDDLSKMSLEEVDFEEDLAILRAFSLVDTAQREDEFEMHGLVQLATRIWLRTTSAEMLWYRTFVQAMAQEFPLCSYATWPRCRVLFPHVTIAVEPKGLGNHQTTEWARVLVNAGTYAWEQRLLAQAEGLVTEAMKIQKTALSPVGSGEEYAALNLLGLILGGLAKYDTAEVMQKQALELSKRCRGTKLHIPLLPWAI